MALVTPVSALSDIATSASEDLRLEFFRCQYLVEIIDRLTYGEVYWLEKRIELALDKCELIIPSFDTWCLLNGLWHAVYQHRRDLQRYAGGPSPKSKPLGKEYP